MNAFKVCRKYSKYQLWTVSTGRPQLASYWQPSARSSQLMLTSWSVSTFVLVKEDMHKTNQAVSELGSSEKIVKGFITRCGSCLSATNPQTFTLADHVALFNWDKEYSLNLTAKTTIFPNASTGSAGMQHYLCSNTGFNNDSHKQWRPQTIIMMATTMMAINHDDPLVEIYPTMLNELNSTFGISFSCHGLWPSWYIRRSNTWTKWWRFCAISDYKHYMITGHRTDKLQNNASLCRQSKNGSIHLLQSRKTDQFQFQERTVSQSRCFPVGSCPEYHLRPSGWTFPLPSWTPPSSWLSLTHPQTAR